MATDQPWEHLVSPAVARTMKELGLIERIRKLIRESHFVTSYRIIKFYLQKRQRAQYMRRTLLWASGKLNLNPREGLFKDLKNKGTAI